MFSSLLIANRGEIACRIIRTAKRLGIRTIAIYSDADREALHVRMADEAAHIGPSPARESYLSIERSVAAAKASGAEAVHPGYGFLSENPKFAEALVAEGIVFVGPPASAIAAMGDKITSKKIAAEAGVSTVPGHMGLIADADEAERIADGIGYPVMIKASAGGGGKGMRVAFDAAQVREGFERARSEALSSFGDERLFIEKFVTDPRHIEIQVLADAHGNVIHLGERECSIQRRNQKVVEEAPSPFLDEAMRAAMGAQAVALAKAVGYVSAGTVEFIVDGERNFYFLEMNTRLQVEHPVTELVTGLDLVELMLHLAAGERLPLRQKDVRLEGSAIEARVYAEDPYRNFLPSSGRLKRYRPPVEVTEPERTVRNDTGVYEGGEISTFYDPMIAKLVTWGPMRLQAIEAMSTALDGFEIEGVGHNLPFLSTVMEEDRFREGRLTTGYIAEVFPDGFAGARLATGRMVEVIAAAAMAGLMVAERRGRVERGAIDGVDEVFAKFAVVIGSEINEVRVARHDPAGLWRVNVHGTLHEATGFSWKPGDRLATIAWRDEPAVTMQLAGATMGFRIRYRGADLDVAVLSPHVAALLQHMPLKAPPDHSKILRCPMPGQVVRVDVAEGEVVEEGQPLAIVEAMKMENVLRAERRARVAKVHVATGAVLAVDQVMMEFTGV
jgi:propionyl-CoA carboxylase alpha chain